MFKFIRKGLKKIYRVVSKWPIIGRFARITVAVIRLPQRQLQLETQQIPAILQSLSDINARQTEIEKEIGHMFLSLPAALREMKRDMENMRLQLEDVHKRPERTAEYQDAGETPTVGNFKYADEKQGITGVKP